MSGKQIKAAPLWLALVAATLAAALAATWYIRTHEPQPTAAVLIGGPFSLLDQTGKRVTDKDFLGRYMLVFFGYTYCPDICPVELQTMSAALDILPPKLAGKVVPIFITFDPERDTAEVLATYVKAFHPRLVGLTGSEAEIADAARAYRVFYQKAPSEGGADLYLMDHSAIIYLIGPDGKFINHFSPGVKPEAMAARLQEQVQ